VTTPLSPMQVGLLQYFVQRAYETGGPFQWVREGFLNSAEAGATQILFGLEWQGVELHGIYRRIIADNGSGIHPDQVPEFLNVFGGGGKPIGGLIENYGVGFKASTLPWNQEGVVVITYFEGIASMIWIKRGEDGEYGLKQVWSEDDNTYLSVLDPYVEDEDDSPDLLRGIDWSTVAPEWVRQPPADGSAPHGPDAHGTVMVLLGNSLDQNTITNDPDRDTSATKALPLYLNTRLWEIPAGITLTVEELRHAEERYWPRSRADRSETIEEIAIRRAAGYDEGAKPNSRTINGARHFIDGVELFSPGQRQGHAGPHGTVVLPDTTRAHWFLWEGDRPFIHDYGSQNGYVAALFRNELYDLSKQPAIWNSFGIMEGAVRERLWLIVEPPVAHDEDDPRTFGVFPEQSRNRLVTRGGPYKAGSSLPWADWGQAFWSRLPEEIRAALDAARRVEPEDKDLQHKLQDKFGERWSMIWSRLKQRVTNNTATANGTCEPTEPGQVLPRQHDRTTTTDTTSTTTTTTRTTHHGPRRVVRTLAIGLRASRGRPAVAQDAETPPLPPKPVWMNARDGGFGEGILAEYVHVQNRVKLNADHFVITDVIAYWQQRYPDNPSAQARVTTAVRYVYGQEICARIAHFLAVRERLGPEASTLDLTDAKWLTFSLLGLYAEDHLIGSHIGGVLGTSRRRS